EGEHRHGWKRTADVGDIDRRDSAATGVAQRNADRKRDCRRTQQGNGGEDHVLAQPNGDAVRALPVRRVRAPTAHAREKLHQRVARAHGVMSRWKPTRATSAATARATESTAPK